MWLSYFKRSGYPPPLFSTPKPNECQSYLFKTIRVVDEAVECIINLSIERADNKSHKIATFTHFYFNFFLGGEGGHYVIIQICDTDCVASIRVLKQN